MGPYEVLSDKAEVAFPDLDPKGNKDALLDRHGNPSLVKGWLHPGRTYEEPRRYTSTSEGITINYLFSSRVWHPDMDQWLRSYAGKNNGRCLDLVILNSGLWDV